MSALGWKNFVPLVCSPPYAYVLLLVVGTSSLPTRRVVVRCGVYVL